jgi:hypothetical protein
MEKQQWTALTTSRLEEKRMEKKSSYVDAHVAIARTHAKTLGRRTRKWQRRGGSTTK